MRRSDDLIRELMLKLEAYQKRPSDIIMFTHDDEELQVDGYSAEQVEYHMEQIHEAGYLTRIGGSQPMCGWYFRSISPSGHDFLDTVRDPRIWRKTKEGAAKIGGAGVGVLLEIGKAVARAELTKLGVLPAA